jgi:hypothetical protein
LDLGIFRKVRNDLFPEVAGHDDYSVVLLLQFLCHDLLNALAAFEHSICFCDHLIIRDYLADAVLTELCLDPRDEVVAGERVQLDAIRQEE